MTKEEFTPGVEFKHNKNKEYTYMYGLEGLLWFYKSDEQPWMEVGLITCISKQYITVFCTKAGIPFTAEIELLELEII